MNFSTVRRAAYITNLRSFLKEKCREAPFDLYLVFRREPKQPEPERFSPEKLAELRALVTDSGLILPEGEAIDRELAELRQLSRTSRPWPPTSGSGYLHGSPQKNGWTTGK